MESRKRIAIAVTALIFAGASASLFAAADYRANAMDQPRLSNTMDRPRISERQAREIGMDRVPQGTVLTERLEQRDGRNVWFLDIAGYNNRSRQEVLIDADTGRVLGSQARALTGPSRTESNAAG